MKKNIWGLLFTFLILISAVFAFFMLDKVGSELKLYSELVYGFDRYSLKYSLLELIPATFRSEPENYFIFFSYFFIFLCAFYLVVSQIRDYQKNRPFPLKFRLPLLIIILILPIVIDYYFVKTDKVPCGGIVYKCENGWHYEKNALGQKIDVHYRVDYNGKRLSDSFVGCGYDGTPADYELLLSQIEGIGSTDNNTEVIYFFPDGSSATLDRKQKPYLDTIQLSAFYNNEISRLMFEGTECR